MGCDVSSPIAGTIGPAAGVLGPQSWDQGPASHQGYRVATLDSVADLEPQSWNRLVLAAQGSVFHSHQWLSAFEEAGPGTFQAAHRAAYDGPRLIGLCPAFLTHRCPRLEHLVSLARSVRLELGGPVLLAHNLAALAGGFLVEPGHEAAISVLAEAFEHEAARLGAWAWGFASLPESPLVGRLIRSGYAVAQISTTYRLEVRWPDAGSYWADMDSRHRRRLLRERRKGSGRGLRAWTGAAPSDAGLPLVRELMTAHRTPLEILPDAFLRALDSHLGDLERSVMAQTGDGRLRGVFKGWLFGDVWSVWIAGLDLEALNRYEPYHALMAEAAESAIGAGIGVVDLGRSNGPIKQRYGASGHPLYLAVRAHSPADQALLHAWCADLERATLDGVEGPERCC